MSTQRSPQDEAVTGLILAAGAGTRLGCGPKALLPFMGRTLVETLADELLAGGCSEVIIVLGAQAGRVLATSDLSASHVLINPRWADGMGSSFQAGVGALPVGRAVLVTLVDQPGVGREVVSRLMAARRPGRVTAAAYAVHGGPLRRGHPILFSSEEAKAAAEVAEGDSAAKTWLAANREKVDLVDCSDLGDGADVDRQEDLYLLGCGGSE
ncbi:nucleotidyltransferase family protein [Paeniglutamicibacter sp. ZC-3]|uniref:nucleotidyltransferase family protein n=1 Tax=Paeniglutamicibacter sp. ZC-3 TaxID=2986919 RepID=UPI0021F6DC9B|nr:nucleotidyltransferase family protein [Paeniglutamicibacter sp. ZC-3]MCV9994306.1 nucleotidyltransferase family protein [Paeniglutamicibacter sp. ZC-3]